MPDTDEIRDLALSLGEVVCSQPVYFIECGFRAEVGVLGVVEDKVLLYKHGESLFEFCNMKVTAKSDISEAGAAESRNIAEDNLLVGSVN
jgi:hypothetical protein